MGFDINKVIFMNIWWFLSFLFVKWLVSLSIIESKNYHSLSILQKF